MVVFVYRNQGFTLVEVLIAIVVIGIALSALMTGLSSAVNQGAAPVIESRALALGQAYADEIMSMAFDDQTPAGGGAVAVAEAPCVASNESQARDQFDDVDDYHLLRDQPPVLLNSASQANSYSQYAVAIRVTCAGDDLGMSGNHLIKRIEIVISLPNGEARTLTFFKGNF